MAATSPLSRVAILVVLVAVALAGAWMMGASAYGGQINDFANDWFFRLRGGEKPADGIVIAAIDDETVAKLGWPMDRAFLASALNRICAGGPSVVVVDLLFTELTNPDSDQALVGALKGCPQTVLAARLAPGDVATLESGGWSEPLTDFAKVVAAVGHAHADPDKDGISRRVLLGKAAGGRRRWALALEAFKVHLRHPGAIVESEEGLTVGGVAIPSPRDRAGSAQSGVPEGGLSQRLLMINYAGGEGVFQRLALTQMMQMDRPETLAGRAVLIGVTAHGLGVTDRKFTPYSTSGLDMPGIEIHANILNTLMSGRFLAPLRDTTEMTWLLAIGAAVGLALALLRGTALAVALAVIGVAAHVAPYMLFTRWRVVAPAFSFSLAYWMPLVVGGVYQYTAVWRHYVAADASSRRMRNRLEMVSHEMRSPLSAIQGSSEVIGKYPLNDERRKQLAGLIHRESQRLATMVERFLDVERLEAGEIKLRRERVPLLPLAHRIVERVDPLAKRKNIQIRTTAAAEPAAQGDPELLEFALYNLVSNAIKYSPEGSIVDLTVRSNSALGMAFLDVADQGAGIPTEEHSRIFDRFYRTPGAQTSGQPGLGLGLAIVREVARHHGGSIMLESSPGRGSKFSMALPLG